MSKRAEHINAMKALGNTSHIPVSQSEIDNLTPVLSEDEAKKFEENLKVDQSYHALFSSKAGKIVLDDLRKACNYNESAFTPDQRLTDWNLGNKDLFRYILKKITKNKD